ncbi:hypothetical protein [Brevundimonas sp. NIBR11]|uniref:hypothetical protein n=1 Tax=Brevundimonas sp. NIBR11 TaxID=3015999 RepID=UPI0022F108E2|nr:hypothetical protein [Brevundimonas sp. NIBR11]WGM31520.1 hypothetical protein KKHFBJBL_01767 [Brevundimonas sp. NIBR11]
MTKILGDAGEANRGIGQVDVTDPGVDPRQPHLPPSAGGPGTGDGATIGKPKHQQPMEDKLPNEQSHEDEGLRQG